MGVVEVSCLVNLGSTRFLSCILGKFLSGPLWTDPQSELQVSESVRFTCPLSRQPANHEDSKAISGLTTNGRRFSDNTHSNPLKGMGCYREYVRFLMRVRGANRDLGAS